MSMDFESGQIPFGCLPCHGHIIDPSRRGTMMAPLDQAIDRCLLPLDPGLDRAIRAIPHPAGHPESPGLRGRLHPKKDPLHAARDTKMGTDNHRKRLYRFASAETIWLGWSHEKPWSGYR